MAFFGVSLMLVKQVPTEFFPASDTARLTMSVKVEQNTHVDHTVKVARQIDQIIAEKYPFVYMVSTSAGANSSNNAFAAMQTTGSHIINYNIRMPRLSDMERPTIFEIADGLRKELAKIPEIREFSVTTGGGGGPGGGGPGGGGIALLFSSANLQQGTITVKQGGTISGGEEFHGYFTDAEYTGSTTDQNVTISGMVTTYGGGNGPF
jgi:multidrug efflux pump subunit AcrB